MRPLLPAALATGLLAATLLTAPTAQAAAETCQGRPATIVGSYLQRGLVGTEGADVVVTNGATQVDTLGGDDVVCVTESEGRFPGLDLDTGAGDDVVDASTSRSPMDVVLGAGSDSYTGSARGGDRIVAGVSTTDDGEPDTIHTGAGDLADSVTSGSPGVPNGDVVVVEQPGSTVHWYGPMAAGARLDASAGPGSTLTTDLGTGHSVVDAEAGTLAKDGFVTLRWTGFDDFSFYGQQAPRAFRFDGSDRDETIYISFSDPGRQRFFLGGGDDTLLSPDGAGGSKLVRRWGRRRPRRPVGRTTAHLDLATGKMRMRQDGKTVKARFVEFETSRLGAKHLVMRGTKRADEIRFYACTATVRGRAGNDDIATARTGDDGYLLDCDSRTSRIRIYGGAGRDTIRGSRGKDLLVGGPGRDSINGNANRDRCSGEKLKSCEIKLR